MQIALIIILLILLVAIAVYCYMYYPQQLMPIGEPIEVATVEPEKYHNDCLHPCIRYSEKTRKYYMAQSPYYGWNIFIENPMLYESDDYMFWNGGILISDTPEKGYNSDPNIYLSDKGYVFFLWRECFTPLCDSINSVNVVVGGFITNGKLNKKKVLCTNSSYEGDRVQCPILIKQNGFYYIYAAWYQYEPVRKNLGIAKWKGTSLEDPDFELEETIPLKSVLTADKCAQIRIFNHIVFFPKPQYHDMWHFDLFEYDGKLYMVSVAEKGDNIMLSVADDWKHFRTFRKPLVNNHYTENYCGYRQYYYKPTAFVKDDILHLFYTANAKDNPNSNQLFHTELQANQILK